MEDAYIINGGKPLKGEIQISGAKNAALKIIIAATMLDQEVTLQHIPRINDTAELVNLINDLGGKAEFTTKHTLVIDGRGINQKKVSLLYGSKIRVSFMFFAPLLYKLGVAEIPNPGGCRLGARSIDRSIEGMEALGIDVDYESEDGYYNATMNQKPRGRYRFVKPSHTGTEFMIMLSVFADGEVILENVAKEPEVDDLINFFNESGADIHREGDNIVIKGVEKLERDIPYTIASDRVEAATYAALAIATKGEVIVSDIEEYFIEGFIQKLKDMGAGVEQLDDTVWKFYYKGPLKAINIETNPYPGFLTDWQPLFAVLMTQAEGVSMIHERILENRFSYVPELNKLGADIEFVDIPVDNPQDFYHFNYDPELAEDYKLAVKIHGPLHLHNGAMKMADIRAGATVAIAALAAEGESVINEVHFLERGYEDFVEKVQSLGGDIKRV